MGVSVPGVTMSSSWKDSSDFASLAAALSRVKRPPAGSSVNETRALVNTRVPVVDKEGKSPLESEPSLEHEPSLKREPSLEHEPSLEREPSLNLPTQHELLLQQHKRTVSVLEFEASGARFLSGGHDHAVAYWDFSGMSRESPQPFRFIEPVGAYGIRALRYSRDSQWVLIAASSSAAKLFDRNGSQVREFAKGDMYIRDLRHTNGHVSALTGADWLPHDPDRFLTASEDGTLRVWHIGYRMRSETVLPVRTGGTGGRIAVTAMAFARERGEWLATASANGALQLWAAQRLQSAAQPTQVVPHAHTAGEPISALAFDPSNESRFVSRSCDGTVRLWDVRKCASPVIVYDSLPTIHAETGVCFAPDGHCIVTGGATGLHALHPHDAAPQQRTLISTPAAVVAVAWNRRTDQLLAGRTDGAISVHFRDTGTGGALLMRQSGASGRITGEAEITAGELHNTGTGTNRAPSKRRIDRIRADPVRTHRPELPVMGPGQGGRIGSSVTQSIMRTVLKDTSRDVDPREALLAYAERAAKHPKWVATAYQDTQPDPQLDARLLEKEAAAEEERRRRIEDAERLKQERDRAASRFS